MKKQNFTKELSVAKSLAKEAGKIMSYYFEHDQKVSQKQDKSLVTIADKKINTLVIKKLKKAFPKDDVIGEEESSGTYGIGRKWFCDPIDGTAGFVYGCPTAMFSLALVIDGVPVLGVLFDPFLNKLYTAIKFQGAFCNGKRLRVVEKGFDGGVFAGSGSLKICLKTPYFDEIINKGARITTFGGAVYKGCLIARSKLIGYIEDDLNSHDVAGVQVLLEEAGAKVSSLSGETLSYLKPFKGAIFSNKEVHQALVDIKKKYAQES